MERTESLASPRPRVGRHERDGAWRPALAFLALLGGLGGLAGLYLIPIPEGNREPLLLALGLVLGWGSTVIGFEFGVSPAARPTVTRRRSAGPER